MNRSKFEIQAMVQLFPNCQLIVGVCNDEMTHRLKGKTVMNEHERAESLYHCRWVDEVIENAPWIVTEEFLAQNNIDYVAHGEDIVLDENGVDIYKFVKDRGQFRAIKRTEGISTSGLIVRIVKDYDAYVRRNLKRGWPRQVMKVGLFKEKQILFDSKVDEVKQKMKEKMEEWKDSWEQLKLGMDMDFNVWKKSSSEFLKEFLQRFGAGKQLDWKLPWSSDDEEQEGGSGQNSQG